MKNSTEPEELIQINISKSKIIAILFTFILFYASAIFFWMQSTIDSEIVIHFNFVYENELYFRLFKALTKYGMPFITAIFALVILFSNKFEELKPERPLFFLVLISFALSTVGGDLLKELVDKARPAISLSEWIVNKQIHETPAFPSGHAAKSMALALPFVIMASRKNRLKCIVKLLVLIAALLVCFSRIVLQAHYLSDVLAGIGTALFFVPIAVWLTNKFYIKIKFTENKLDAVTQKWVFVFIGLTVILCFM